MAVYQGTRPRAVAPTARPLTGSRPVTRRTGSVRSRGGRARARPRPSPVFLALLGVVGAFLVALVYLTQTLQTGALNTEIARLLADQETMRREIQSQQGTIARWGAAPQVIDWAHQYGLDPLGGPVRVPRP